MFSVDVAIIGGCGRAGLPLGLAFADRGLTVTLYDRDAGAVASVESGMMPFQEELAEHVLTRVRASGQLHAVTDPSVLAKAENLVMAIDTPVDGYLSPNPEAFVQAIVDLSEWFRDGQLLVLRSTVYPGVTRLIENRMRQLDKRVDVAFCPERITEGKAMLELFELPQIVSSGTEEGAARADKLFRALLNSVVQLNPEEAELAKLFTNAWRYTLFAVSNQFFMIANDLGLDYERIRQAMKLDYPRAEAIPSAGFAAGPCLFKDSMQLAAFNNHNFPLGHAAMAINEGLPLYVVSKLERRFELGRMTVGLLGMAFKAGSDDPRASLSYKLKRILVLKALRVICTDPYVGTDPDLVDLDEVLREADLMILCTPHQQYVDLPTEKPVVDIWDVLGRGTIV